MCIHILLPIGVGVVHIVFIGASMVVAIFYWCFYGGWHAPITISAAKPKPIAPIYVQVKPSSDLFQALTS